MVAMSGWSSRGRGKGKRTPFLWEGLLGPNFFEEALYDKFPVESKRDFTKEAPLRGYDDRKEEWPKCMHGEDCLMQMFTKGIDGGRHFFKCPRAWVIDITIYCFNMLLFYTTTYKPYCSLPCLQKNVVSLGRSILELFIHMRSTSTTCRTVSSS
jgi:hypothetical protein